MIRRRAISTWSPVTRSTAACRSCVLSCRSSGRRTCCGSPSSFLVTLAARHDADRAQAVKTLLKDMRRWEVCSAARARRVNVVRLGADRTAHPRQHLLIRRHLRTGELAFHYCYVPDGRPLTQTRLIRVAGLRWPVEEDFEFGKDDFGLDQSQVRLYTAILRHIVLVWPPSAVCAVTAAQPGPTDTQAPPPVTPDQPPPADPGLIPLTVPEIKRLFSCALQHPKPARPPALARWRRRHQARARWFHQRTRLGRDYALVS